MLEQKYNMCKGLWDPAKGQDKLSGFVLKGQQTQHNLPHSEQECGITASIYKGSKIKGG